MHQLPSSRQSSRAVRVHEELVSSDDDSQDSSVTRVYVPNSSEIYQTTLPTHPDLLPTSTTLMINPTPRIESQAIQENTLTQSLQSRVNRSFAETQLLSVYYLNQNINNLSDQQNNLALVEQQQRRPIKSRASRNPSTSNDLVQVSPSVFPRQLSTRGSAIVIDANQQSSTTNDRIYEQRLKIHSGSQRLAHNQSKASDNEESLSPSELIEESRYSYEEYVINVDNKDGKNSTQPLTSPSPTSTSSATTILTQPSPPTLVEILPRQTPPPAPSMPPPQPPPVSTRKMLQVEELDSDRTSRLSVEDINTQSSTSSMSGSFNTQDWQTGINPSSLSRNQTTIIHSEPTTRVSSWPPAPYDLQPVDTQFETSIVLDDSDEQRRPSRVQFAEQLVHIIPPSATNSISEESATSSLQQAPLITPRTILNNLASSQSNEQNNEIDIDEDSSTTTTTTTTTNSSNQQMEGRLQRTSGVTNLNEMMIKRPSVAPPPPPPLPTVPPVSLSSKNSGVDPNLVQEQLKRLDYQLVVDTKTPVNQSKWVKDHMDSTDAKPTSHNLPGRVGALRSLFEQQGARSSDSSTVTSPIASKGRLREPEERPSKHGDEIRFRVKEDHSSRQNRSPDSVTFSPRRQPNNNTTTRPPAPLTWEALLGVQNEQKQHQQKHSEVVSSPSSSSIDLDEIRQITGKPIRNINEVGFFLQDRNTWQWNESFWFSLTPGQREKLKAIRPTARSRQGSGDTQIYEPSDRSAYQGDSEDNTTRGDHLSRQRSPYQSRGSSQENLSSITNNRLNSADINRQLLSSPSDRGSTVSVTGAGAWQNSQSTLTSTGVGKYTETSNFHERNPTVSVFGSTPTGSRTRMGSQESIASSTRQTNNSNKKTDNQMTVIESGYSSADEPAQRTTQFRPNSSTIIEETSVSHQPDNQNHHNDFGTTIISSGKYDAQEYPIYENLRPEFQDSLNESDLDPYSYEQFVYDYISNNSRRIRSDNGTLTLMIDGQQIHFSDIHFPSNSDLTLSKNIYLDAIDELPPPFETEYQELVIFVNGEPITLPADRWSYYRKKYSDGQWIQKLDRVNRRIPSELIPIIEQWLSEHTTVVAGNNEINVDGLSVPLIGRLGSHIIDMFQIRRLQSAEESFWSEVLKYLIRSGYVSFDHENQIVHIAESQLEAWRLLRNQASPSPELIERLANYLRGLDQIHFDTDDGRLILGDTFSVSHTEIADLFEIFQEGQNLNANELAVRLLQICDIEEDQDGTTLLLTLGDQVLQLSAPELPQDATVIERSRQHLIELERWLTENLQCSIDTDQTLLFRYRTMPNHVVRVTGNEGLRLSNLLQRQVLQYTDLLEWHENHIQIDQTPGQSLRMIIKPNKNIEIVNLASKENMKGREKVNEERSRLTNEKSRKRSDSDIGEGVEEKNLVFFIPLHSQNLTDNEEEKKEKEKTSSRQHSFSSTPSSPSTFQQEQKKLKSNSDRDANAEADDREERTLFLQSIASLLHFINANGSNVGTLELVQGRRLKLSLTGNSPISQQQQSIEFDERDTDLLVNDLQLDIDACSDYFVNQILDQVRFDSQREYLFLYYRGQMMKLKNLKQKFFQPSSKKLTLNSNKSESSTKKILDEQHVTALTSWLEQLNSEAAIEITEQNDIVILPQGADNPDQQILINHEDVDNYMDEKLRDKPAEEQSTVVAMEDIARILLIRGYIQYQDGSFSFGTRRIAIDRNELIWLRSIIRNVRPDGRNRETEVDLFDGENTQGLRIPYEHMPPTNNPQTVADYLFQNGTVRYDLETGEYAYRYVPPDIPLDDEDPATERQGQREILSSHIRQIHVDERRQRIEIEFIDDPNNRLVLPTRFFRDVRDNDYDRMYIIDIIFANGGSIQNDRLLFNDQSYSLRVPRISNSTSNLASEGNLQTLKLSSSQKKDLIERYVNLISEQDGIKREGQSNSIILINTSDDAQLVLTREDSESVLKNQSRKNVTNLLYKNGDIKQDEFGNILLFYNKQYVQLPTSIIPTSILDARSSNFLRTLGQRNDSRSNDNVDNEFRARLSRETQAEFIERYHGTIDYMSRNDLITCNRRLKLVQLHFSNQTLTIPLEHLKSIIDTRKLNSATEKVLPFENRALSEWLLTNSDTISNTREGYIALTHKGKLYNFPLINPNKDRSQSPDRISTIVKKFGLKSRAPNGLAGLDLYTPDKQRRCAMHLLEHIDNNSGINIDNDSRRLILSMTSDNAEQMIINNPVTPVTKETLTEYLLTHGRFTLTAQRDNIEYRYTDDGYIYRFGSEITDWERAFDETNDERILRVLGEILSLNGRFLQRADRQIIIILRNGDRFIIPSQIGAQLLGPVNGQTIAELLMNHADDIYEEQDGKFLVIRLADQTLRLQQQRQLMSSKPSSTGSKSGRDPKLKLLFPFNKSLREIQKTPSTSTLNVQPPDASNGYAIDPLLMLANYIYRAATLYQDDYNRLVIKMNEDEIVVPKIEAINAIEAINTSPNRTGTIVARLIDRIGKVQSNKAGGIIITIGRSSFELPKEMIDRATQLHRETIDIENDLPVADQDMIQAGLNGSMTLNGRRHRHPTAAAPLPSLRQSKSVGSLNSSAIGHPWFTDDQQMLYNNDGRGDARYLNLDNYALRWQKEPHKHGIDCEVKTIKNVAPYFNVLGYTEDGKKKGVTLSEITRLHPEMVSRGKMNDTPYLNKLEDDRAKVKTSLCPKPRILVIPEDETMLSSNPQTRIYVQYMYENEAVLGADPAYVMMLPSRYPVRPTRPQLIAPHHYRDIALREAPVYVRKNGEDVYFENLAQYLAAEHPKHLPSSQVRRMLKLDNRDEYSAYLRESMPATEAEKLVRESENQGHNSDEARYTNIPTRLGAVGRLARRSNENLDDDFDDENMDDQRYENESREGGSMQGRMYYNIPDATVKTNTEPMQRLNSTQARSFGLSQPTNLLNNVKFIERSPSTSSQGSDFIISNAQQNHRAVLGNAPSSNIPNQRRDIQRSSSNNPLSSFTDENYGRPVPRTPK